MSWTWRGERRQEEELDEEEQGEVEEHEEEQGDLQEHEKEVKQGELEEHAELWGSDMLESWLFLILLYGNFISLNIFMLNHGNQDLKD